MLIKYLNKQQEVVKSVSIPLNYGDLSRILFEFQSERITDNQRQYLGEILECPEVYESIQATQDSNTGLLPCPSCGHRPEYEEPDFVYPSTRTRTIWSAHCCKGGCGCGWSVLASSRDEAIQKWQTRSKPVSHWSDSAPLHPVAATAYLNDAGIIDGATGELTEHYRTDNE